MYARTSHKHLPDSRWTTAFLLVMYLGISESSVKEDIILILFFLDEVIHLRGKNMQYTRNKRKFNEPDEGHLPNTTANVILNGKRPKE